MTSDILCILADIPCQFLSFYDNLFFSTFSWKLDSYQTEHAECPHLFITKASLEVHPTDLLYDEISGFFNRQVYANQDGSTIWQFHRRAENRNYLQYKVSSDYKRITLLEDLTETAGSMAFEYLAQMMPACMLSENCLTFHGVLMEYDGYGLIISADSGVGKSTHARLWRDHKGALILNGDRSVLRKIGDTWYGYGTPWSGTSGEQINRRVPIKAFVSLNRGTVNEAHQMAGMEAFPALFANVLYPNWDAELTGKALELLDSFLTDIPIINLHCLPDADAVDALKAMIDSL